MKNYLSIAIAASIEAGAAILDIYKTDFDIEYKLDDSPLTLADKRAHEIIVRHLAETSIPVLSEEGRTIPYAERVNWSQLWIVDPLDGTKEFVKKNDEFTVNLALVRNGIPILGVIYAPVPDLLYFGDIQNGAFLVQDAAKKSGDNLFASFSELLPLSSNSYLGVVASRSHLSSETAEYIQSLKTGDKELRIISKGSSLKLCMIAEGTADIYPRFAPTSEWDIAAGHAIIKASGGRVTKAENQTEELEYNKPDLLNPSFIAFRA